MSTAEYVVKVWREEGSCECHDDYERLALLIDTAIAETLKKASRAALVRYGRHLDGCGASSVGQSACTCGFEAACR